MESRWKFSRGVAVDDVVLDDVKRFKGENHEFTRKRVFTIGSIGVTMVTMSVGWAKSGRVKSRWAGATARHAKHAKRFDISTVR
uniref:Uncharacterized protein n=1 Tax=Vespula pensylvanica TaxID=30213 RepID=A0A834U8D7_VESPE|nr:hypothetical protein H0235_009335 [Vespula pensylvanica]